MCIEMRCLVFTPDELTLAALAFCRRERIALPDAALEEVDVQPGAEPSLALCFRVDHPMEPDRVVLSARQLKAAMLEFCRRHGIPVARRQEKEFRRVDGGLAMFDRIEYAPRCREAANY